MVGCVAVAVDAFALARRYRSEHPGVGMIQWLASHHMGWIHRKHRHLRVVGEKTALQEFTGGKSRRHGQARAVERGRPHLGSLHGQHRGRRSV
ncbi:hypothetical protein DID96_13550 [Burkholderia sp. Bp8963]|nr:hypothetical protein DID96_13550 [Burkholderia sp. Bp8963]